VRSRHITFDISDAHGSAAAAASSTVRESATAILSTLLDTIDIHELLPSAVRGIVEAVIAEFGSDQLPTSWRRHPSLPFKLIRAHASDESVLALVHAGSLDGEENNETLLDCAVSVAVNRIVEGASDNDVDAMLTAFNTQLAWLQRICCQGALRFHHESPLCEVARTFVTCNKQGITAHGLHRLFLLLCTTGVTEISRPADIVKFWALLRRADRASDTDDAAAVRKAVASLAAANRDLAWKLALQQTLEPTLDLARCDVVCAVQGQCVLPRATQILDECGDVVRVNETGRRTVTRIKNEVGSDLYLKIRPELPGVESMVRELGRLLFGNQSMPHVELALWIGTFIGGVTLNDPVLLSQGVPGSTLQDVLKLDSVERDAVLHNLDSRSVSEAIVLAMLTMPEDGKPDNYICEPLPSGKYGVVCIDNDHAFAPPFCLSSVKGAAKLVVKCVLFCMDHMHHVIHPDVRDALCNAKFDPLGVVQKWLGKPESINAQNRALFESHGVSAKTLWSQLTAPSFIGVPFPPGSVSKLCAKLRRLQLFLGQAGSCTHMDILWQIEPLLAARYTRALTTDDVWTRFKEIDGSGYELVDGAFKSPFGTHDFMSSMLGGAHNPHFALGDGAGGYQVLASAGTQ
jgi:hypothetical protein